MRTHWIYPFWHCIPQKADTPVYAVASGYMGWTDPFHTLRNCTPSLDGHLPGVTVGEVGESLSIAPRKDSALWDWKVVSALPESGLRSGPMAGGCHRQSAEGFWCLAILPKLSTGCPESGYLVCYYFPSTKDLNQVCAKQGLYQT